MFPRSSKKRKPLPKSLTVKKLKVPAMALWSGDVEAVEAVDIWDGVASGDGISSSWNGFEEGPALGGEI